MRVDCMFNKKKKKKKKIFPLFYFLKKFASGKVIQKYPLHVCLDIMFTQIYTLGLTGLSKQ